MSERTDAPNLPFWDDAKRAESEWLLAREVDPTAPAPSPKIASDYAEIEELLANLSSIPSDSRWQAEVLSAGVAQSRSWWRKTAWRWIAGGVVLATAAVAVVLASHPYPAVSEPEVATSALPPDTSELAVAIRQGERARSPRDEVAVGDRLVVTARPRGTGDLRVYRADGVLVAKCPRGPGCRLPVRDDEQTIEITFDAPVKYLVILVVDAGVMLPESSKDAYLEAARAAGARIIAPEPIDVH